MCSEINILFKRRESQWRKYQKALIIVFGKGTIALRIIYSFRTWYKMSFEIMKHVLSMIIVESIIITSMTTE